MSDGTTIKYGPDALRRMVKELNEHEPPICRDLDKECVDVKNPLACWQYQPERGQCPFLRNRQN